jgi:hypothetical protein
LVLGNVDGTFKLGQRFKKESCLHRLKKELIALRREEIGVLVIERWPEWTMRNRKSASVFVST